MSVPVVEKVLALISHTFSRVEKVQLKDGGVAIRKTFAPTGTIAQTSDMAKLRQRFIREVKVQASLPKEHFVPILYFELDGEAPWFLMPLADANFVDEIKAARAAGIVPIDSLRQIVDALDALHKLGFTHRDLKPQNVLRHDGVWKLSDFGLVRPMAGLTQKLTSVHSAWGTESYCAPEQVQDFAHAGPPADIYAFGCILHDIVGSGTRVPFHQHSCAGPLAGVIEKCTEIDPKKRFKTATAAHEALVLLCAQPATGAQGPVSPGVADWVEELKGVTGWDAAKLEAFTRFVMDLERGADKWALLREIDEEAMTALLALDQEWSGRFAEEYCAWVRNGAFDFVFCDVLIRRVEQIYGMDAGVALKASAAVAAACLGSRHNRWFVMDRVLHMCSPSMDDNVAQRLVIEIIAEDVRDEFESCATVIDRPIASYHARIVAVLAVK